MRAMGCGECGSNVLQCGSLARYGYDIVRYVVLWVQVCTNALPMPRDAPVTTIFIGEWIGLKSKFGLRASYFTTASSWVEETVEYIGNDIDNDK